MPRDTSTLPAISTTALVQGREEYGPQSEAISVPQGFWGIVCSRGLISAPLPEGEHGSADVRDIPADALIPEVFQGRLFLVRRLPFSVEWSFDDEIVSTNPRTDGVRLSVKGRLVCRVRDARRVVATMGLVLGCETDTDAAQHLEQLIRPSLAESLADLFDLQSDEPETAQLKRRLASRVRTSLDGYGLDLVSMIVKEITLPDGWVDELRRDRAQLERSKPTPAPRLSPISAALQSMSDPRYRSGSLTAEDVQTVAICRACRKPTTVDARFCPRCGAPCEPEAAAASSSSKPSAWTDSEHEG